MLSMKLVQTDPIQVMYLEFQVVTSVTAKITNSMEQLEKLYSQKKRTFNSEFFGGPSGGGGPKIHMADNVNGSSIHAQFLFR